MLSVVDATRRTAGAPERKAYARIPEVHPIPNLIDLQLDSFRWFVDHGLRELFEEISPIQDFTEPAELWSQILRSIADKKSSIVRQFGVGYAPVHDIVIVESDRVML